MLHPVWRIIQNSNDPLVGSSEEIGPWDSNSGRGKGKISTELSFFGRRKSEIGSVHGQFRLFSRES